eukprot:TRINITY_DN15065_c0_g1_i16.p1 TRINITY_DN15065_c0_g1~~TRINITY_DN15065_c0_g1_i16.p1  ORF type:complete len:105 (+),score=19.32 TRINITY_DN15065_c0_g1_i16:25-315(+)
MIRRPPRSTHCISSAASDVYKRQAYRSKPPAAKTKEILTVDINLPMLYISFIALNMAFIIDCLSLSFMLSTKLSSLFTLKVNIFLNTLSWNLPSCS